MLGLFYVLFLTGALTNCQTFPVTNNNNIDTSTTSSNEENTEKTIQDEETTTPQNTNTDFTSESYDLSGNETEIPGTTIIKSTENEDEITTESFIENSTEKYTGEAQDQTSNFETTKATTNIESSTNPLPTITINLPTITTITTKKDLCEENEVYSCLPWCPRTCNNPLSKLVCRPSRNSLCRRGCTCKNGFLYENTIRKCVKQCPVMQLL
ncbi:unnamed protein product [Ceutorhynchus assimilis]|uniref:TIL domain-containing protein n=1 Tax=Ceutorhynchus assimilis TaxID=467358 RepID=A0A9N9MS32_9CUCU|nr:unnamed protein product [Ceutorhynchus assimilis]